MIEAHEWRELILSFMILLKRILKEDLIMWKANNRKRIIYSGEMLLTRLRTSVQIKSRLSESKVILYKILLKWSYKYPSTKEMRVIQNKSNRPKLYTRRLYLTSYTHASYELLITEICISISNYSERLN